MLGLIGFTEAIDNKSLMTMTMKSEDLTTCKHGRRQSPIDIITDALVLDLSLRAVKLHGADQQVSNISPHRPPRPRPARVLSFMALSCIISIPRLPHLMTFKRLQ